MRARLKKWILLSGHRYSVASGTLVFMIGIVLIPVLTGFAIRNTSPLTYLASALITGNVTLVTVVVAINQVVLSQELESPGSLRDEIEQSAEYRQAALDEQPPPTEPSDFLHQLLQQTCQHTESVGELLPDSTDEVSDHLLTNLPEHCNEVRDQVESASNKLANVIVPILGVDYGDYIHDCHQIQARYDEDTYEQLHVTLDLLTSDLKNLDVARQYFTTAFMKEELAILSRSLLYISILAVSTPIVLLLQLTTYTGASPPMPELFVLTVIGTVFGLLPLALLIAFVLRIATVAQQIAAITPFQT